MLAWTRVFRPLRAQLEEQLRESVRRGRLAPGVACLLGMLSRELGVSRGVVVDAYAQLAAEGYLVSHQGAPTRVSDAAVAPAGALPPPEGERAPRFDFRPGGPDVSLFPRAAWLASLRRALRDAPDARLDYGDPRGAPELRHALGRYLGRVRGVVGDPERIVVTSGMAQGMAVFARALAALGGRRMAIEDPSSAAGRAQLASNGLDMVSVSVDHQGLVVEESTAMGSPPTRSWSHPRTSSAGRGALARARAALVEWATRTGALVLEDDTTPIPLRPPAVGAVQGSPPNGWPTRARCRRDAGAGPALGWLVAPRAGGPGGRGEGGGRSRHPVASSSRSPTSSSAASSIATRRTRSIYAPAVTRLVRRWRAAPGMRADGVPPACTW